MYRLVVGSPPILLNDLSQPPGYTGHRQFDGISRLKRGIAKMTKTTFCKKRFLTLKYLQNTVKFRLPIEKDKGNKWGKNQGKIMSRFF